MKPLFTLLVFFSASLLALDLTPLEPPQNDSPIGIYVIFQKASSLKARDGLHRKMKVKLQFRSSALPLDSLGYATANPNELETLCDRYRKESSVVHCALDYRNSLNEVRRGTHTGTRTGEPETKKGRAIASQSGALAFDPYENDDKAVPIRACTIEERPEGLNAIAMPGLSAEWQYEYVGADLGSARLKKRQESKEDLVRTELGVVDAGFIPEDVEKYFSKNFAPRDSELKSILGDPAINLNNPFAAKLSHDQHGTNVVNTLMRHTVYAKINDLNRGETIAESISAFENIAKRAPDVVSVSMAYHWRQDPKHVEALERVAANKTIVVFAAGNYFPYPIEPLIAKEPHISVGSIGPHGDISGFVSAGNNITVYAPSDDWQVVTDNHGGYRQMSGTSGAAPIVSGAIANITSLLNGKEDEHERISAQELKKLLNATRIPTGGVGMLNAYKLTRTAEKLKDMGWPNSRTMLASDQKMAKLVDFTQEAAEEFHLAEDAMKHIKAKHLTPEQLTGRECNALKYALEHYRKAFFLSGGEEAKDLYSTNGKLFQAVAKKLSQIYKDQQLPVTGQFYENFSPEKWNANLRSKIADPTNTDHNSLKKAAMRSALYAENPTSLVVDGLKNKDPEVKEWALYVGLQLNLNHSVLIKTALQTAGDRTGQAAALILAIANEETLNSVADFIDDSPQPLVGKQQAINALFRLQQMNNLANPKLNQAAYQILKNVAKDNSDLDVRRGASAAISESKRPTAFDDLAAILRTKQEETERIGLLWNMGRIQDPRYAQLVSDVVSNPNSGSAEFRAQALHYATEASAFQMYPVLKLNLSSKEQVIQTAAVDGLITLFRNRTPLDGFSSAELKILTTYAFRWRSVPNLSEVEKIRLKELETIISNQNKRLMPIIRPKN